MFPSDLTLKQGTWKPQHFLNALSGQWRALLEGTLKDISVDNIRMSKTETNKIQDIAGQW